MMTRLLFLFASALLSFACFAQASYINERFTDKSGRVFVADVAQHTQAKLSSQTLKKFGHWGAEGRSPSVCVSTLRITRNKSVIRLSSKHYADLCNVNRVWFAESPPFVVLTLQGGDASDSFKAEFKIHGVNLIERAVRDGQFPQVFEVTRFNYPVVIN